MNTITQMLLTEATRAGTPEVSVRIYLLPEPLTIYNLKPFNMNHDSTTASPGAFARLALLVAFIATLLATSCNDTKQTPKDEPGRITTGKNAADTFITTLAAIRTTDKGVEVLFSNKQAIYKMSPADTSRFEGNRKMGEPLKIVADSLHTILSILTLNADEAKLARVIFSDSIRSAPPAFIDVNKIDTTVFNLVDRNRDFRKWRLTACKSYIQSFSLAQDIFNFCAAQSCNLPGPYTVNPCIPFQYVIDGCYARAHKMRWIIETRYGYCSYKVFSFANQGTDVLAVRASKWGGCCVSWWYHVAPVVYVLQGGTLVAYVIDPGMFNGPVTLSTWLQAQQTITCNAKAHVSTYTIQPSSAYSPANYAGTAFTTDPNYVQTNQTLIAYKNGKTCP